MLFLWGTQRVPARICFYFFRARLTGRAGGLIFWLEEQWLDFMGGITAWFEMRGHRWWLQRLAADWIVLSTPPSPHPSSQTDGTVHAVVPSIYFWGSVYSTNNYLFIWRCATFFFFLKPAKIKEEWKATFHTILEIQNASSSITAHCLVQMLTPKWGQKVKRWSDITNPDTLHGSVHICGIQTDCTGIVVP